MGAEPTNETIPHTPNGFTSVTPYFRVDDGDKFIKFVMKECHTANAHAG